LRVFFVIGVLGPAIEDEIVERDTARSVLHADRAGIAHPATIGRHVEKSYVVQVYVRFFQNGANARFGGAIFDKKENAFNARKMAHDFREGPGNRSKFSRPIRQFMRPAKPCAFVRLPFGGHAIA